MPQNASRRRPGGGFATAAALAALLCAPAAQGQIAAETVGKGEFPGLQLLPPGSVLKGISLPRYVDNRVAALFTAERMEVKTRSLVVLSGVKAHLYDTNGEVTDMESGSAHYDFARARAVFPGRTRVDTPRLEARGTALLFDTERRIGILKGPVGTAIRTDKAENAADTTPRNKP